jgi:phenylalanyl-tRNA synthetase beta chain
MARVIKLVEEIASGKLEGVIDLYPKKTKSWKIKLDLEYMIRLLGENVPVNKVKSILESLDLKISKKQKSKKFLEIEIPTQRIDLQTQEDLIEEIGRIYGYEKIRPQAPHIKLDYPMKNEKRMFERSLKNILTGMGFDEVYNYSFYSARDAELAELGPVEHLELQNPMSPEQALIRVSLVPGILKNVRENLKNFEELHIFEIGKVYWPNKNVLPEERRMLIGAVVQKEPKDPAKPGNYGASKRNMLFYEAKSFVDSMLEKIGMDEWFYDEFEVSAKETSNALWHGGRVAEIRTEEGQSEFGIVGEISPLILSNFDIHKRVAMFEIDLDKLQKISETEREYQPISKFPTVARDISMLAENGVLVDDILENIQKSGGDLVQDVDLFDIFEKDGRNSFAFHIVFGASDRTLEHQEIDGLMQKIISSLEKDLGVEVRK